MNRLWRCLFVVSILVACLSCDQAAKQLAQTSLGASPPRFLLHGAVQLELVRNRGAFLSLGEELPTSARSFLFVTLVSVVLVAMLSFAMSSQRVPPRGLFALSLLAGGGAGNLLDRLLHDGAVVDFVSLGIGPVRTGVFNLADTAILVGILLLASTVWPEAARPATPVEKT